MCMINKCNPLIYHGKRETVAREWNTHMFLGDRGSGADEGKKHDFRVSQIRKCPMRSFGKLLVPSREQETPKVRFSPGRIYVQGKFQNPVPLGTQQGIRARRWKLLQLLNLSGGERGPSKPRGLCKLCEAEASVGAGVKFKNHFPKKEGSWVLWTWVGSSGLAENWLCVSVRRKFGGS